MLALINRLAQQNNKLVVKVPDSAGSAGNFVVSCPDILDMGIRDLHRFLAERLAPVDGNLEFPLMLQVWKNQTLKSPSIQIWIPDAQDGPPFIEGLFTQLLSGPGGPFAGAAEVMLPPVLDARMTYQGMMLARALQALGYFGRCSFDAVISGADLDSAELLWSPGRDTGIIFLTPSGFETGENLHFISLSASLERA